MAETSELITEPTTEQPIGGATKASRGRPSAEFYQQEFERKNGVSTINDSYYQHRCHMLENELNDAERKARNLVDELLQVKRELSEDRTELLLKHQQEISNLKEEHRNQLDAQKEAFLNEAKDLQKQIDNLEKDIFKKDLEQKNGERSAGNRLLDMAEEAAPQLLDTISGFLGAIQNQSPSHVAAPFAPAPSKQIELKLNPSVADEDSGAPALEPSIPVDADDQLSSLLEKELNKESAEEEV